MSGNGRLVERCREGVSVDYLPADRLEAEIRRLDRPWLAEEGPISVKVRRLEGEPEGLLPRGLAFDATRTVTWDEHGVDVVASAEADEKTVALKHRVLVRERFGDLPRLARVDYVESGVWVASRYVIEENAEGGSHA